MAMQNNDEREDMLKRLASIRNNTADTGASGKAAAYQQTLRLRGLNPVGIEICKQFIEETEAYIAEQQARNAVKPVKGDKAA